MAARSFEFGAAMLSVGCPAVIPPRKAP